jgi:SAM-dependent methyltransferase
MTEPGKHQDDRGGSWGGNAYQDDRRADAYAALGFAGTYYLAFRDLPDIVAAHVTGTRALDFGCGAGRSTRLLRDLGFDTVGVDISAEMVGRARALDPGGRYLVAPDGELDLVPAGSFDLVLAAFPFDNIPGVEHRIAILSQLRARLPGTGRLVLIASAPELYVREWASFSTRDFPENAAAGSGDVVRIVITDGPDRRPIEDQLWRDGDYRDQMTAAGLALVETYRPLATGDEPWAWVHETEVPPWVIYVAGPSA